MFKHQARYLVSRRDPSLWSTVLSPNNTFRKQIIDQIISTALPETQDPEDVSITVKAFMSAELPNELIEILEKLVLQGTTFNENRNLQNLLILTAINAEKKRVMGYVKRLNNFDSSEIANISLINELFEEAYFIYTKFNLNVDAINVLLFNIKDLNRAEEFAVKVDTPEVWSKLGKGQLGSSNITNAIGFILF
jgi:clathrin heavy chain